MNQEIKSTDEMSPLEMAKQASERVYRFAVRTPLVRSSLLSERVAGDVRLKLESMQETGSFKIRGASNKILKILESGTPTGLVAVSSGNHGRAVAYVARQMELPAVIYMTQAVPQVKRAAIERLGAEIHTCGDDQNESEDEALRFAKQSGFNFVPPYDDLDVIAGQGTIALEILDQWPEVETLIVPLSGGGLLGGVSAVAKLLRPDIRVIGISCDVSAAMDVSVRAGRPVLVEERPSIADALPGPIMLDNKHSFRLCHRYVDDFIRLSEADIESGLCFAFREQKLVLEGAGAIGIAALLADKVADVGNAAIVCSGSNISVDKLAALCQPH